VAACLELLVCLIDRQPQVMTVVVLGSLPAIVDCITIKHDAPNSDLPIKGICTRSPHCKMHV
jgi:hypothetical protein